jgi:hypothetical protein
MLSARVHHRTRAFFVARRGHIETIAWPIAMATSNGDIPESEQ